MKLNCIEHAKAKRQAWQKRTDASRPAWHKWLWSRDWRWKSKAFLMEHSYICRGIDYYENGERKHVDLHPNVVTQASVVDHVKPHRGDITLFHDQSNWQSLCRECHNYKTAKLDGGFGNQTQSNQRYRVGGRSNL
jgi:5-methylcytosine-specific restriction endonuclease McrA